MAAWKGIVGLGLDPQGFRDYVASLRFTTWRPQFVVLHHTAIPTLGDWHALSGEQRLRNLEHLYRDQRQWSAGPHLVVADDLIWVFTPLTTPGVHSPSWNHLAWGVEMVGDFDSEDFQDGPGAAVRDNTVSALATLHALAGLDPAGLRLHREDPKTTHRGCPGRTVSKPELVGGVAEEMARRSRGTAARARAARREAPARTPDVAVLVPGFLGFARFGGFYYFADRLIAVVRGLLEEALGYPVPVVPVTTLPTDSLRNRQRALLENLTDLCAALPGVERIALVGHSTGGVDAQLLACTTPLEGGGWARRTESVRRRIRSVVTIGAPHYGTGLADSRLARWGENPLRHPTALLAGLRTLVDLLFLVPRDLASVAGFQTAAPNDVLRFMWQIATNRDLIDDLSPRRMEDVRARVAADPEVALTCFVTGTTPRDDGARPSDPFFRDLYRMTEGERSVAPAVAECESFLRVLLAERRDLVIRSGTGTVPALSATLNDGVVNSARQIVHPGRLGEVGGFVVADHADVLGHYDRRDALVGGRPYNSGLFHSGAGFGDDEFFGLYRRVARAILRAIPGRHRDRELSPRLIAT